MTAVRRNARMLSGASNDQSDHTWIQIMSGASVIGIIIMALLFFGFDQYAKSQGKNGFSLLYESTVQMVFER